MLQYSRDVEPFEMAGKSDAEIAAIFSTLRVKPVPLNELEAKLTLWQILERDPATNERRGVLVDVAQASGPLQPVARQLLSWIGSARSMQVSTDTIEVSPIWAAGIAAMVTGGVLTQGQADILNGLAGGLVHGPLVADDVAACRTAFQAEQAARDAAEQREAQRRALWDSFSPLYNAHLASVLDGDSPTVAGLVAGLRAAADALEA